MLVPQLPGWLTRLEQVFWDWTGSTGTLADRLADGRSRLLSTMPGAVTQSQLQLGGLESKAEAGVEAGSELVIVGRVGAKALHHLWGDWMGQVDGVVRDPSSRCSVPVPSFAADEQRTLRGSPAPVGFDNKAPVGCDRIRPLTSPRPSRSVSGRAGK